MEGDAQGRVFLAGSGNHRIQLFAADKTHLGSWGGPGSGQGRFANPNFVAVDGNDGIYVSDGRNGRVQKFQLLAP